MRAGEETFSFDSAAKDVFVLVDPDENLFGKDQAQPADDVDAKALDSLFAG